VRVLCGALQPLSGSSSDDLHLQPAPWAEAICPLFVPVTSAPMGTQDYFSSFSFFFFFSLKLPDSEPACALVAEGKKGQFDPAGSERLERGFRGSLSMNLRILGDGVGAIFRRTT